MAMIEVIGLMLLVVISIGVGFVISTLIEVKRTVARAGSLIEKTEPALQQLLQESSATLKQARGLLENANAISADVREVSSSVSAFASDIRNTGRMVHDVVGGLHGKLQTLLAGLAAALAAFGVARSTMKGGQEDE